MRNLYFIVTLYCVTAISCLGNVLFHAGFENGLAGKISEDKLLQPVEASPIQSTDMVQGIRGKGCLVSPDSPLVFPASEIINPVKGSLSFWIKPMDWEAGDREMRPIFWLGGSGAYRVLYYLLLTGNNGMPQASLFTRLTGTEMVAQYDFRKNALFAKNKWTFVVINWNAWQIELFLNGKIVATRSYSLPVNDYSMPKDFNLWFGNGKFWGKDFKYTSVVDEIRVYDDIRTPQDVEAEYLAQTAKVEHSGIPHRMPVPRLAQGQNIRIDGRQGAGEWDDATCIPLNKEFFQATLLPEKSFLHLKHDGTCLYFLFETDSFSKTAQAEKKTRSMDAFSHDVFEAVLRPAIATDHTVAYSQFAISPKGYWALHHQKNWNALTKLQYAIAQKNGFTFIEGRLPLREIAPDFHEGQSFQAEFGYTLNSQSQLSSQERIRGWVHARGKNNAADYSIMYHYPEAMGELVLARDASYVQIRSFGRILYGQPEIRVNASKDQELALSVRNQKGALVDKHWDADGRELTISAPLVSALPLNLALQANSHGAPSFFYEAGFAVREPLQAQYEFYPEDSKIVIMLDASGLGTAEQALLKQGGIAGNAELKPLDGQRNANRRQSFNLTQLQQRLEYSFSSLEQGRYELSLTLDAPQGAIAKTFTVIVPEQDFLANERGYERKVFAPWTPVKTVSDTEISMVGRTYRFNELGMPEKIVAWNEEVLSSPVEFLLSRQEKNVTFRPVGRPSVIENCQDRVIHAGRARSADGTLCLDWKRTCEFDGMVLYRIEVSSAKNGQPLELDKIQLQFQVSAISSRYLMAPGHIDDWNKKHEVRMRFLPFYWLSGIRTGLDFFLPDDGNWRYANGEKVLHFSRRGHDGAANVVATVLKEHVSLDKPLVYTFGFLATPARPLPPAWRREHVAGWGMTNCQTVQDYWCYNEEKQQLLFPNKCLLSEVVNESGAHAEVALWHRRNTKLVPYSLHTCMPDNNRFYDFFGTQWRATTNGIPQGKSFRSKWMGKEFYMCAPVCPVSSYSKFLNWCVGNLMTKYDFDGVYLDGSQTSQCDNHQHGCGYTDAFGRAITPYNDLGCRNSFRALYQTIHGINPDGVLYTHANIMNAPHVHSMCDILLPGEELMPDVVGHPKMYTDNLPLERWQSSYNVAKLLGTNSVFLGMTLPYDHSINRPPKDPKVSNPLLAMCLVHDINMSGNFIYCKTSERIWQMWDKSGISSGMGKFVGYWYPECEIRTDNPKLLLSYYEFPEEKRCIMILANPTPNEQKGKIILPSRHARYDLADAQELYIEKKLNASEGVTIPNRDFMVIEIKGK